MNYIFFKQIALLWKSSSIEITLSIYTYKF